MPERTLDQVIQHYQAATQQLRMPTPVPPPMVTPGPPERPPYIVPNAFQRTYAPGVSRTIEDYMRSGAISTPQALALQSIGPTTVAGVNQQWTAAAGNRWGGAVGAVAGGVAGSALGGGGAFWGSTLGEMLGGSLGLHNIPGVGWGMRQWNRAFWGGAMEQTAASNQLRQGLFGNVQMLGGQGDALTGTGLNAPAALQLAQRFGRGKPGGMSRMDMVNLTTAAGEMGFLENAANVDQIVKTVENLTTYVGKLAKLTGNQNFRQNVQMLSNMREQGMNLEQATRFMESVPLLERMAGGVGQAGAAAGLGSSLFQRVGLTSGLGREMGLGMAGAVHRGMGGITPVQRGLWGGEAGVQDAMQAMQAEFMGSTTQLLLPYLVQRGAGGELSINQERMRALRSGRIGFQEMVAQGTANMGALGIGSMQDLLLQAPELQTQLGHQLGPMGGFATMMNMAQRMRRETPGLTLGGAASVMAGGGERGMRMGRMMEQFANDPNMIRRMIEDIEVQQRQFRLGGRHDLVREHEELEEGRMSVWDRTQQEIARALGNTLGVTQAQKRQQSSGVQRMRAFEKAQEQARADAEASGYRTVVHRPGAVVSEREIELSQGRVSAAYGRILEAQSGAATGMSVGELSREQVEAASGAGAGGPSIAERVMGVFQKTPERMRALEGLRTVGAGVLAGRRAAPEALEAARQEMRTTMKKQFGDNYPQVLAAIKTKGLDYAREVGQTSNGKLRPEKLRQIITRALRQEGQMSAKDAERWMAKNGDAMVRWMLRWIDQSGNKDARRAMVRSEVAAGMADQSFSADALELHEEAATKDLNKLYYDIGLSAVEEAPSAKEEAGIAALFGEEDQNVRAAAMLMGEMEGATAEEKQALAAKLIALEDKLGPEAWRRAQDISKTLTAGQRRRLATRSGKRIARGETTVEELGLQFERGIRGERGAGEFRGMAARTGFAELERRRREAGITGPTEAGVGAGAGSERSDKQVQNLEEQKQMLEDMAKNMNEAATSLKRTSAAFAEVVLRSGVPTH